jgi:hypothetical protein
MANLVEKLSQSSKFASVTRLGLRSFLALIGMGLLQAYAAQPSQELAGPPLYATEQGNAKVYILGAAGGNGDNSWYTPAIRSALLSSKEFWQETPPPIAAAPPTNQEQFQKLAFRDSGSLFDGMSEAEANRLIRTAQPFGITREQLARMRPWFAAAQISIAQQGKSQGPARQTKPPEAFLLSVAQEAHIQIHSEMATFDDYTRFMADLSEKAQYQYLSFELDMSELGASEMANMDAAWAKGNVRPYEEMWAGIRKRYPDMFAAVNSNRNRAWIDRIKTMLAAGGSYFISVGLFHTLGPDSIQAQLERGGLPVHRVETIPDGSR